MSYRNTTERMTRWECHKIAQSAVSMHKLDKCSTCLRNEEQRDMRTVLGRYIQKKRRQSKLTQSALSRKVGIDQTVISRIEKGTYDCRLSMLTMLLEGLNLHCRPLPWYMVPAIDNQLNLSLSRQEKSSGDDES